MIETRRQAAGKGRPWTNRPTTILICINRRFKADEPSCAARGSIAIAESIEKGVRERRIDIVVDRFICFGQCTKGPTVKLVPGDFILGTTPDMVDGILDRLEAACGIREEDDGPPLHLLGSRDAVSSLSRLAFFVLVAATPLRASCFSASFAPGGGSWLSLASPFSSFLLVPVAVPPLPASFL